MAPYPYAQAAPAAPAEGQDTTSWMRDVIAGAQKKTMTNADHIRDEEANAACMDSVFGQEQPSFQSPLQKTYFTGEYLSKYEPCVEALKKFMNTENNCTLQEQEDAWEAFDEHWARWMEMTCFSNWDGNKYDIVMYGVSGYTGYLMMEYLKRISIPQMRKNEPLTFAFAGRTARKVAEMRDKEFGGTPYEDTPIIAASYDDCQSVIDLCKSAHVILNVAGPYMLTQGEMLVDSCIHTGCDYVDVNGEIPWKVRIKDLHESATKKGVSIVPSAAVSGGFPDLLTYVCAHQTREATGESLRKAVCYCTGGGAVAGASGGTLASRAAMSDSVDDSRKLMADPFALGGFIPDFDQNGVKNITIQQGTGFQTNKMRKEDLDAQLSKISEDKVNGIWRAPHTYAYFDTRCVRRTNMLLADRLNQPYGIDFNYQQFAFLPAGQAMEQSSMAPVETEAPAMPQDETEKALTAVLGGGITKEAEKEALQAQGKYYKQGEGPPLEELGDCWIAWLLYAESPSGHQTRTALCGGDGYFETARAAVECCQTLRWDKEKLQMRGGMLTGTAVGGLPWYKRIVRTGMRAKWDSWLQMHEFGPPDNIPLPIDEDGNFC